MPPQETVHPIRFWQRSTLTSLRGFLCRGALGGLLASTSCWAQPSAVLTVEITPQPLSQALIAFAEQTSIQLIYVSKLASDRMSRGAPAGFSAAEALTRVLEGTGLRFEFLNSRTVRFLLGSKHYHINLPFQRRPVLSPKGGSLKVHVKLP